LSEALRQKCLSPRALPPEKNFFLKMPAPKIFEKARQSNGRLESHPQMLTAFKRITELDFLLTMCHY